MKRPKYMTAIGHIVVILPDYESCTKWNMASFDKNGTWKFGRSCTSLSEAKKCRAEIFKHHRALAKTGKYLDT